MANETPNRTSNGSMVVVEDQSSIFSALAPFGYTPVTTMGTAGAAVLASSATPDWRSMRVREMRIKPSMDPRLQVAVARQRSGAPRIPLASTGEDEIAVIAKVSDLAAWENLSEVKPGQLLGQLDGNAACLVTGRIPVKRIEAVREQPFVLSMKASQALKAELAATVEDMRVTVGTLPLGIQPTGGAGVVVGIVDFGCDFAHANFRNADGSTRIEAIWHQAGPFRNNSGVKYGRLIHRSDIDAALAKSDPYAALKYGAPHPVRPAHGTHVMDIAAGNGLGSGTAGCAPDATIIFVEASAADIHWSGPEAIGQSFGDSVQMLEAVQFIFEQAGDRPCVVNLSLGTNGGPHDGTTLVEQGLDALIRAKPNRAIVIAAANSNSDGIHLTGGIPAGGHTELSWQTENSPAGQEMEIWMQGTARIAVEVIAPDGTSLGIAEPNTNMPIGTPQDIVVYVSNRLDEPNNHDAMIGIFVAGSVGGGVWTIRLHERANAATGFHAWIERLDQAQSSFVNPTPGYCLGSISCGMETICVGSYDAHKPARPLSYFSSHGPTRDGRHKPELSAPGHAVMAARSGSVDGVTEMSGTSMAAPAVTGLVALVYAEAQQRNLSLNSSTLRQFLIDGVMLTPPNMAAHSWDPGYGYGRASASSLAILQSSMHGAILPSPKATCTTNPAKPGPKHGKIKPTP